MASSRNLWPLTFCALIPALLIAQPEWKLRAWLLTEEATHLAELGQHRKALGLFQQAFELDALTRTHCYDAVSCALAVGDTAVANKLLSMGVRHGFDPHTYSGAADLQTHLQSPASQSFRNGWQHDREVFAASCDSMLIKEIEAMHDADQAARRGKGYTDETRRVDSLNFEKLIALVEKSGFPNAQALGLSVGSVHLLLWHHRPPEYPNSAQWQRTLPHIRTAMAKGNLGPNYLCMFDDMADSEEGKPQRYGTLLYYYSPQPDQIFLVDRQTLNRNRASVGLGPIEWSAEAAGIDLSKVRFATK